MGIKTNTPTELIIETPNGDLKFGMVGDHVTIDWNGNAQILDFLETEAVKEWFNTPVDRDAQV